MEYLEIIVPIIMLIIVTPIYVFIWKRKNKIKKGEGYG